MGYEALETMIDDAHPLLLGSGSPRRREILTTLGLPLRVAAARVDEAGREGEAPREYLARVTADKLAAAASLTEAAGSGAVLVADTIVLLDGSVLGKPRDDGEARAMIAALSGREHEVWTRFAIGAAAPARELHAETVATRVTFRALGAAEIDGYVATGEGRDKAGAYAVQGIGAFAVQRIDGSYSNVVGLPACEVILALCRLGLVDRFPRPRRAP